MESILKTDMEQKLLASFSEMIEPKGYRIVDLDCRVGGKSLLRLFIERKAGESQVSLEDCVAVSRILSEMLETTEVLPGAFDLEVSSPGLDRRLRLRPDFDANQGQEVELKLVDHIEGVGARVKGTLLSADEAGLRVEHSGRELGVPWMQIKQANRIWKME